MPGQNILGKCDKFWNSIKTATTCSISATLTGFYKRTPQGSGVTITVDVSGTVSKTFTRVPFDGPSYYNEEGLPGAEEFWLAQNCCCRCRAQIIFGSSASGNLDWSRTESGGGGDGDASGTNNGVASLESDMLTRGECKSSGETPALPGRMLLGFGIPSLFSHLRNSPFHPDNSAMEVMDKTWEDIVTGGTSGIALTGTISSGFPTIANTDIEDPGFGNALPIEIEDNCAEEQAITVSRHWTGEYTANPFGTGNVDYELDVTMEMEISLG